MLQLARPKEKPRTAITILCKSAKMLRTKQRFEGSACAKSLGPDRRKVNSARAQGKVTAFCNWNRRFRWQQVVSGNEATIFAVMNATAVSVEKE
jgi:hypothetical protein